MGISRKEILKVSAVILAIFFIGFFLRLESVSMPGVADDEKAFYQDQNGLPYMYELDSYYNYRLTENYINHGYLGDILINGKNWDLHSYYPPGRSAEYPPLIVYVAVLFYYFLNTFGNVPLIISCFWLPAVMGSLSGVVAYLFVRRFTNDYGAFAAGIFIVTAPFYFIRTVPGWFDTDMFIVLFPLLIMWLVAEGVYTKNTKKRIFFAVSAAFAALIFSKAWEGWAYVFYIVVSSFLIYIIVAKLFKFEIKNVLQVFSLFTCFTILFIVVPDISNFATIIFPFNFIQGSSADSWPDILFSVSELGNASIEEVISGLGFIFFAGILSLLWIFRVLINKKLKEKYLNRMTWFFYLFIITWTIMGIFALTKGARFIMVLLPPVAVSSGIMVGICIGYLDLLKENKKFSIFKNKNFIKLISIGVILLVIFPGIINVHNTSSFLTPLANDDLWTASQWIKDNTSNDTVIISEWSYGYLLSAVSKRPVSVDGGSQNFPRTYWIDRAFSTDNENLSQGIFRMIATSGDQGSLTLDNYTKNTTKTVEILNSVLGLSKDNGLRLLTFNYGLSVQEANTILNYTHPPNPRPFVLVTTRDMVNKGFWTFYFGLWDFNQKKGHNLTYSVGKTNINNNILNSSNGFSMDLKTGNVTWNGKTPYLVVIDRNGEIKKRYVDKYSDFSVFFIEKDNKTVILDKCLENSLFIKLVIERRNSTNFKPIYENKNVLIWESNTIS